MHLFMLLNNTCLTVVKSMCLSEYIKYQLLYYLLLIPLHSNYTVMSSQQSTRKSVQSLFLRMSLQTITNQTPPGIALINNNVFVMDNKLDFICLTGT